MAKRNGKKTEKNCGKPEWKTDAWSEWKHIHQCDERIYKSGKKGEKHFTIWVYIMIDLVEHELD